VYTFTMNTLDTLPLHRPSATQSRDLLRVLVFAAAARLSVQQAYDQLERAPSGPTVLGNLARQCSDLDALEGHVNALLARLIPKGLGKRGRHVAVDVVALPSHGTVEEAHQDEVYRSKAKGGTTHFFTYATASAVVRGRRYTLALCRVRAKQPMDYGLRTPLARLVTLGIRIKLLLLDRGFYRVRVLPDLITCAWPFIMPAVKRGKKPTTPGGPTGTYALAAEQQGHWTSYPYNATFFSPLSLGAYDVRDTLGDYAVGPRLQRRGSPQSYTHAGVTRLRITGGAATPSALALFFPKRPFKCHRKKCASIVSTIWCCQPVYLRTS
jgi:hypothetical protein